jgi:GH25 family lysozyme M1 (1,4-beta-N-acetylmuramidase)
MTLFGPDAASFQGTVNWGAVDGTCAFGWEKVTEGTGYVNPYWPAAKTAMLARQAATGFGPGAYLFLRQGGGAAQADYFARHAGSLRGFGLVIDVEPEATSRPTLADAVACARELRQLFPGHPVGGYLPRWYWDGQDTTFCDWLWASEYLSGFGSPGTLFPRVPASWWAPYGGRVPRLLQFTSTGILPGIGGPVDVSAFAGTPAQYAQMTTGAVPVTPPAPVPHPPPSTDWQVIMMDRLPVTAQGASGAAVRRIQALLRPAGAPVAEDGQFGPATAAAVRHVQAAHGLAADAVVGPKTWAVLVTGAP